MKLKLVAVAALVACSAVAMPTDDELAKATKEVQASLKTQIAAWQSGDISDGDLAALMLMHAGKFKDETQRYACLQAAFAAAVRAGDAVLAANAIEKIAASTKGFGLFHENALFRKAFGKMDAKKAEDPGEWMDAKWRVACRMAAERRVMEESAISEQSRALWRLLSAEGIPVKEAAKRLGIPANTASKIKRRMETRILALVRMYEKERVFIDLSAIRALSCRSGA